MLNLQNYNEKKYWNNQFSNSWITYEKSLNERFKECSNLLYNETKLMKNFKALDVGCGTGHMSYLFSQKKMQRGKIMGVDLSKRFVRRAQKKYANNKNLLFKVLDAQVYLFPSNYYTNIFSRFGVMFFNKPIKAFKNLKKSMRKNANFTFICWAKFDDNDFFKIPLYALSEHFDINFPINSKAPGPFAFSDVDYIYNILKCSGFNRIKIKTISSSINTKDTMEKNAEFLTNFGTISKYLRMHRIDKKKIIMIKKKIISSSSIDRNSNISYKASFNLVNARS